MKAVLMTIVQENMLEEEEVCKFLEEFQVESMLEKVL